MNLPKFKITVLPFRPIAEKPCNECPFRKKAAAGWLGDNPPENFTNAIYREEPIPCHLSLDYEDKHWERKWEAGKTGKLCKGALVMAANMCKRARNQTAQPHVDPDREECFAHGSDFIAHHGTAKVRSWELSEPKKRKRR